MKCSDCEHWRAWNETLPTFGSCHEGRPVVGEKAFPRTHSTDRCPGFSPASPAGEAMPPITRAVIEAELVGYARP